ncbi:stage II sporulation protein M [Capnocytophaga catalasegens]|uniref:Membrane protein n=1 Tax=Capnocytophaga catalasegens TaxID=1004260 RepID=A0AAV5ASF7_9FLAO|nr:stage II sporulation protein M [Capnocytophaga catalasegens]GIZ16468.1 membrane protein [Capnocytophaga catalasegens]GJM50293.1 membrane protein [Capnocytophaga catalasegens]GJM53810.1 membrane protein [Capnocytophaga catalasegens]
MREVAFIKQNKEKWLAVEEVLNKKQKISPDQMADLYIHLLGDLSFSQTYYPKSNTTIYLNFLVSQIYQKIYKTKRVDKNRFIFFFKEEAPRLVYKHRKIIYFSFILFFFFVFLGVISARYDDEFVRVVLGDYYVNMTLDNIEKGDPMAVYKSGSTWGSSIGITINNIKVAFWAFLCGVTAGVLTFYIAFSNAVMLGAFQYFFWEKGVFVESLRAIWLHGAMEIFSIVIATAAGFVLTKAILFPKTYSRILSFKIGFKEGLKILLATVPFFVIAGIIEGYVTRLSATMPLWLNLAIIFGTLSIITYYFLFYPLKFAKK